MIEDLKLEVGKSYKLRNGLITSPLAKANNGTNYIWEAKVDEFPGRELSVMCWLKTGRNLTNITENRHDIVSLNNNSKLKHMENLIVPKEEAIAAICHQANKAWCEAHDDLSQKPWRMAEEWQRESAIAGVKFRLENPEAGHDAQHNAWMKDKLDNGWVYGEVKNADLKTHPCIIPFEQLSDFQQKKDVLFGAIVDALK